MNKSFKNKLKHYFKEIFFFIIFITLFANGLSLYKAQSLNKSTFSLKQHKLVNSTIYTHKNDKALLVHIWASWCPVCKLEASNIQRVSQFYETITIAVNSGSNFQIRQYLKENALQFPVINDKDMVLAKKFNVAVYPTTLIYDKENKLVFSEVGYTSTLGLLIRMWWASF